MMKKSFLLYLDTLDILDTLTIEECGLLFLKIKAYHKGDEYETENRVVCLLFQQFEKQFIRDDEKWETIKEKRSIAGAKHKGNQYTQKGNGTSVPKLGQNGTNGSVSVSVSDSVSVKDNILSSNSEPKGSSFSDINNTLPINNSCTLQVPEITGENIVQGGNVIEEREKKFDAFWNEYPNKQGKAKARIYRSKIKPELYDRIIQAVRMYKTDKRETKYYKHADARLNQKGREDFATITRAELLQEMDATRTRDAESPSRYGQMMKPKYKAVLGDEWEGKRFEDKESIKSKWEAKRKEYRLSHNGQDLPCTQQ